MKLYQKVLAVICALITILWIAGRVTNTLLVFKIPTGANEPTIKIGDFIFASKLFKPQPFDFIVYKRYDPEYGENFIFRLCGSEGDKVQIKDGSLFINDKNSDSNILLNFLYTLRPAEFSKLDEKYSFELEDYFIVGPRDSVIVYTNERMLQSVGVVGKRQNLNDGYNDEIKALFGHEWSPNNFGPLVVPKGKYFVLGDNRDNARDSRFVGFIDKTEYVATVIGVK